MPTFSQEVSLTTLVSLQKDRQRVHNQLPAPDKNISKHLTSHGRAGVERERDASIYKKGWSPGKWVHLHLC